MIYMPHHQQISITHTCIYAAIVIILGMAWFRIRTLNTRSGHIYIADKNMAPAWKTKGPRWTHVGPGGRWKFVGPKKRSPRTRPERKAKGPKWTQVGPKGICKFMGPKKRTTNANAAGTTAGPQRSSPSSSPSSSSSSGSSSSDPEEESSPSSTGTTTVLIGNPGPGPSDHRNWADTENEGPSDTDSTGPWWGPGPDNDDAEVDPMDYLTHGAYSACFKSPTPNQRVVNVYWEPELYGPQAKRRWVIVKKNVHYNPIQDPAGVHTLQEKALFTAAKNIQHKEGWAALRIPDKLKKPLRCRHHFHFHRLYRGRRVYNTGSCEACCMEEGCKTCCAQWNGKMPGWPAPPHTTNGAGPTEAIQTKEDREDAP